MAGAAGPIPASSPVLAAGEGRGRGLGTSGGRFGHLAGTVVAPASAAPAARESGLRGYRSLRAGEDHVWFKDRWVVASLCDE
jgi:hypothetical protein